MQGNGDITLVLSDSVFRGPGKAEIMKVFGHNGEHGMFAASYCGCIIVSNPNDTVRNHDKGEGDEVVVSSKRRS